MRPEAKQRIISPAQLICMNNHVDDFGYRIDLAYARADNLLFGEQIYRADAKLWLYQDLAKIIFKAAEIVRDRHNLALILYDGLRTIDAQEKMLRTARVKDNPQWLEEPRLLSPPGTGGHPRGMAADLSLETIGGKLLDMGTPFDHLAENAAPEHNKAHRNHPNLSAEIKHNRAILDNAIADASAALVTAREIEIAAIGLSEEWWDFRFPSDFINQFLPLRDKDLSPEIRLL